MCVCVLYAVSSRLSLFDSPAQYLALDTIAFMSVLLIVAIFRRRLGTQNKQTNSSTSDSMPHRSKEFNRNRRCNRAPFCCRNLARRSFAIVYLALRFSMEICACAHVATEIALNICSTFCLFRRWVLSSEANFNRETRSVDARILSALCARHKSA